MAIKRRKFLVTSALSAILTVAVAACASGGSGTAEDGTRRLVMATSADYPPYEYVDSSSGTQEIVGFDVEIAQYITEELGYELEIQNIDFNSLIPALQANRADFVMAGMTPTEERRQNVDFSDVYYEARNTIVSRQGSGLTSPESLAGKAVGVQLGSTQEQAARDLEGLDLKPLNRITEMIQELKAGRIDAIIMEDTVAEGFLASNPDLEANDIPNTGEAGSAIAFPQGSELRDEFNPVLQEMISSGKMDELITKWFGDESPAADELAE
ncbi:ABC transporter substrate-binding protein [filamentous cyanobacterium CCP1]|nr:ABC transporter substrate-binding protein [filamentous cyanobacterium CCP2]PSB68006.1 ABC transporter substrate-binding protein [filamentous cyanobacterium CCP1]